MGGFDHGPATAEAFDPATSRRNSRYGLALFAIYLAFYAAYVLLSAFRPQSMDIVLAGINLSIWYGFGLIIAAIVLALVYAWLCRRPAGSATDLSPIPRGTDGSFETGSREARS